MGNTHKDCRYYLPVDVFKGMCKKKRTDINADDSACDDFQQIEQCKVCGNYTADGEYNGKCMGRHTAYPDMIATTCRDFRWKE